MTEENVSSITKQVRDENRLNEEELYYEVRKNNIISQNRNYSNCMLF